MSISYSSVGVDVGIEREASKILYEASRKTWDNRKGKAGEIISLQDGFSGVRYMKGDGLKGLVIGMCMDGTGRKPEAVERAVKLSADKYCSASIMLGKTAEITHDFEVMED